MKNCSICGNTYEPSGRQKYCSQDCADEARRTRNRERWRVEHPGWDDGRDKTCEECGISFTDNSNTKHAKYCSDVCAQRAYYKEHSNRQTWDEHLETVKESAKRTEAAKMIAAAEKRFFSYRAAKCVECGDVFGTYQPNQVTCSPECSKKRQRRRNDKRLNADNIVDRDITLATLYKRDKGICYICGAPCDYDDYTRDGNNVTCGITYPSIDHLIPLARGGKHSWDNVRLAHHRCNSVKSDTIPEQADELIPEDAYILARKIPSSPRTACMRTDTWAAALMKLESSFNILGFVWG